MSKHYKITGKIFSISTVIILLFLFVFSCEGPTGGDFVRPSVTFLDIAQTGDAIDDTVFFSREIKLTAEDNEELDRVELYAYSMDLNDTSKILPVETFTGNPPYSYMWETDTGKGLPSGQYKFLAGVWDKVGYYYQEFRIVLLRGANPGDAAAIGTITDVTGAPLKDAYISVITSNSDTLAKNTGVSSGGGAFTVTGLPIAVGDTSVFAKANYLTESELYTVYSGESISMEPRRTYTINFGMDDATENYDYLKISNINFTTTQIVEVDTSIGKSDSVTFQFDYEAWVSNENTLTPNKDAWLVIAAANTDITDSTSMAVNLGDIGFKPGVSNTMEFSIKAPDGSFPNDVFTIYAALVDYAASENQAFDFYNKFYLAEQRILKIGKIKVQWK